MTVISTTNAATIASEVLNSRLHRPTSMHLERRVHAAEVVALEVAPQDVSSRLQVERQITRLPKIHLLDRIDPAQARGVFVGGQPVTLQRELSRAVPRQVDVDLMVLRPVVDDVQQHLARGHRVSGDTLMAKSLIVTSRRVRMLAVARRVRARCHARGEQQHERTHEASGVPRRETVVSEEAPTVLLAPIPLPPTP